MVEVSEYLKFERECRELAAKLTKPDDRRALELMAQAWARLARERKQRLEQEARGRL